ncbi:MAG: DUF6599 family protein [bacterium]
MSRFALLLLLLALGLPTAPVAAEPDPAIFGDPPPPAAAAPPTTAAAASDLDRLFPASGRIAGWVRSSDQSTVVEKANLGTYLGGGEDLYEEYGVTEVRFLDYTREGKDLRVELFRLKTAEGAYGLYSIFNAESPSSLDADSNTPPPATAPAPKLHSWEHPKTTYIPPKRTDTYHVYPGQGAEFFKGSIYGRIAVGPEVDDLHVLAFVTSVQSSIAKDGVRPALLHVIPRVGRLEGTERYVMGPLSILEVACPIPGDLWALSMTSRAMAASYRISGGQPYDLLVVELPNALNAKSRYDNAESFLKNDQLFQIYPTPSRATKPCIVVQDKSSQRFLALQVKDNRVWVYFNMTSTTTFSQILAAGGTVAIDPGA